MRPRHLSLLHGGLCRCERCRFENRVALAILLMLSGACLGLWLSGVL